MGKLYILIINKDAFLITHNSVQNLSYGSFLLSLNELATSEILQEQILSLVFVQFLYWRFLRAFTGFFCLKEWAVHLLPCIFTLILKSVENRGKKIIRRRQSGPETLDGYKTYCMLEEDHFDWRGETTFIHHAMISYTATSDFKTSHPPTSFPKPPLSSAINHHVATRRWAQSKVTLHPPTNTTGGAK